MKAKRRRKKAKGKAEGFLLGRDVQNVTGAGARLAKAPSVFDARARASARAGPPKPPKEDTNPPDALLDVPVLRDFLRTWSRKAGGGRALSLMKKELLAVLHAVVEVGQAGGAPWADEECPECGGELSLVCVECERPVGED